MMSNELISVETEETRLEDLKKIAENWDRFPERAKGRIEGTVSTMLALFVPGGSGKDKKAG